MKLESLNTLNDLPEVTKLISSRAGAGSVLFQILDYYDYNCTPWPLQSQSWGSTGNTLDLSIYLIVQSEK